MKKINPITNCRSCDSEGLSSIISLGDQYISNFVKSEKDQGIKVPLELVLCNDCRLLQQRYSAPPESLWGEQYWYKSGINPIIRNDLEDIVVKAQRIRKINAGGIVLDIGTNDGTLLDFYDRCYTLSGFEPCGNVSREAIAKGYKIINNFFNAEDFQREFLDRKARIITAISMFYDLEDPNKFLEDIVSCLDKDGLFVIQQNYLVSMLEQNAFDNICHEHREFYSLHSLTSLLERHGLEVFDLELNNINGGSIRTYVRFKGSNLEGFEGAKQRIVDLEEREKELELDTIKPYQEFASRVDSVKKQVMDFLEQEKAKGKTIGVLGASTRGNTTLQYFGITPELVVGCAEANPDKWRKKTVGTLIPIMSIDEMKRINPDYQLVLIWHLLKGLQDKEKEYLKKGGKFILPLPEFKIIGEE